MIKSCKKCRREGTKLMLKGERCLSTKCGVVRRSYAPGDHGQSFRGKLSEYGKQLREKQKARRIYGIDEAQFKQTVKEANAVEGNKAENMMRLIERRIDNIVYRIGFASSRSQARQYVSHGLFTVNGKRVKTASYRVKVGDVIKPKTTKVALFKEITLSSSISWLDIDTKALEGKVKHLPTREEIDTPINENLIIEFYSR